MNILSKTIFGSRLYGTDTANSDTDFKGVFMPDIKQVILHKGPQSINEQTDKTGEGNTAEDTDTELYSLPYFVQLALQGQTVALDMLHTPQDKTLITSAIWWTLVNNKNRFYTSNMKSFVGFAKSQASRYSAKGPRYNSLVEVCELLEAWRSSSPLFAFWDQLPVGEFITKESLEEHAPALYTICGRKLQSTVSVKNALECLRKAEGQYGARAKGTLDGADWKAMSHALRAAFEVLEIYRTHNLTFPLHEAPYLKEVRAGKYTLVEVSERLESLITKVEQDSLTVDLPKVPDTNWAEQFVVDSILGYV